VNAVLAVVSSADVPAGHDVKRLERTFSACFYDSDCTLLEGGFNEPLYQPATHPGQPHMLHYREDFFASALHEIAHWCIAGANRRKQVDFGYWYAPDGRTAAQQKAFEQVEVKPQALEWFFSKACGYRFRISVDNLNGDAGDTGFEFELCLVEQAVRWRNRGLPGDAAKFFEALCREFGTNDKLALLQFSASLLE